MYFISIFFFHILKNSSYAFYMWFAGSKNKNTSFGKG